MSCPVHKNLVRGLFIITVLLFCETKSALGIVVHPNEGEPNLIEWTDRPDPNVVGRWGSSGSCVAVSSNCVITTRHQGGGIGTYVEIGGNLYIVTEAWNHSTADIRIAKLYAANLNGYVLLNTSGDGFGVPVVIGGYGKGRGSPLINGGDVYGYTWSGSNNQTRRWGQNKIDTTGTGESPGYSSEVIIADFDEYGVPGKPGAQPYEAILATWDSGGGWFIYDVNEWKVAGLSRAVEHLGESWFDPPDTMDAVRVSFYAAWISSVMPEYVPADLTGDDWVDFADFAVLASYWQDTNCESPDWCGGADFEPDGDVDWADLLFLVDNWLNEGGY